MKDKLILLKQLGFSDAFLSKLDKYDKSNTMEFNENEYFCDQIYKTIDSNTLIVKEDQNKSTSFFYIV